MKKLSLFIFSLCFSALVSAQLIKISTVGDSLVDSAKQWDCVLDNETNLMWEVKRNEKGLQDRKNTYTWFDGISGVENGEYSRNCHLGKECNTQGFIKALNESRLCQAANWRLPNTYELRSLLVFNNNNPLINTHYFPNTRSKPYWTSTSREDGINTAVDVPFFYGGTYGSGKSFDSYIRAVSDVK